MYKGILGQDELIELVKSMVISQEVPKSMIFSGASGTGKTTLARQMAVHMNCIKSLEYSCGECINCKTKKGIIEIDSALNSGVENIRQLIEISLYRSIKTPYRIFIIDEAHLLSYAAQSALLKTLEESHSGNKFFLVTTNPEKLQDGIITRSLDLHMRPLDIMDSIKLIRSVHHNSTDRQIRNIVSKADGIPRKIISMSRLLPYLKKDIDLTSIMEGCSLELLEAYWICIMYTRRELITRLESFIASRYSSKDNMSCDLCKSINSIYNNCKDERLALGAKYLMMALVDTIYMSINLDRTSVLTLLKSKSFSILKNEEKFSPQG